MHSILLISTLATLFIHSLTATPVTIVNKAANPLLPRDDDDHYTDIQCPTTHYTFSVATQSTHIHSTIDGASNINAEIDSIINESGPANHDPEQNIPNPYTNAWTHNGGAQPVTVTVTLNDGVEMQYQDLGYAMDCLRGRYAAVGDDTGYGWMTGMKGDVVDALDGDAVVGGWEIEDSTGS